MAGLDRGDTHPFIAVAHVKLRALAGLVPEALQMALGHLNQRDLGGGGLPETQQPVTEHKTTVGSTPDHAMAFEGNRQAVGGCSAQLR